MQDPVFCFVLVLLLLLKSTVLEDASCDITLRKKENSVGERMEDVRMWL